MNPSLLHRQKLFICHVQTSRIYRTLLMTMLFAFSFTSSHMNAQCENLPGWIVGHETCYDYNDGTICCASTATVFPVSCSLSPSSGSYNSTTHCFYGVHPGTYQVSVTYNNSCNDVIQDLVVLENTSSPIVLNPTITGACTNLNGQVCVNPTGGFGSFSYAWENSSFFSSPFLSTSNCTGNVAAGTYWLRLRDYNSISDNNCEIIVNYAVNDITPVLTATVIPSQVCICPGGSGSIDLSVTGNTAPPTFSWTGQGGFTSTSEDISGLCVGSYTVVVTAGGCSSSATYVIGGPVIDFVGDIIVTASSDLHWTAADWFGPEFTIDGNIIVQSGAHLTIDNVDIRLTQGHEIRINSSAHLSATNGATFDAVCTPTWRGFRVFGVGANPSTANQTNRGRLNLDEGTEVRHAECAIANYIVSITAGNLNYANNACATSGGNILCEGTLFEDNVRDVSLMRFSSQMGDPMPPYTTYLAQFINCHFVLDQMPDGREATAITAQSPRILLDRVTEVFFMGCRGIMTPTNQYSSGINRSIFLQSFRSLFDWYGCEAPNAYNTNTCGAEVSGFTYGFWVQDHFNTNFNFGSINCGTVTTSNINNVIHISGTDFNCVQGVYANTVENIRVINNVFDDIPPAQNATPIPAYRVRVSLLGAAGLDFNMHVAGNTFISSLAVDSPFKISPALSISNGGGKSNFVISNTFQNFATAASFWGENRADASGGYTNIGLHYECNTFINNIRDVAVNFNPAAVSANKRGVASRQAQFWGVVPFFQNSAGNNYNASLADGPTPFLNPMDDDQLNTLLSSPLHEYVYVNDEVNDFNQEGNLPTGLPFEMSNDVQDLLNAADIGGLQNGCSYNFTQSDFSGTNYLQQIVNERELYLNHALVYEVLLDGGNSEALLQQLEQAGYNDALSVFNNCMAASPNLSEESLVKIVQMEDVLPSSLLTIVLASNSRATKIPAVMAALDARTNQLDSYQMGIVYGGRNANLSPIELVERMMANARYNEVKLMDEYRESLLSDEDAIGESASYNLYHQNEFIEDALHLAFDKFDKNDLAAGGDLITFITSKFDMEPERIEQYQRVVELIELNKQVQELQSGVLTSIQFSDLETEWLTNPFQAGNLALNMLVYYVGYEPEWPEFESSPEPRKYVPHLENNSNQKDFVILNNPVNDLMVVRFNRPCEANETLNIFTSSGQILKSSALQQNLRELSIDVSNLPSGVYFVRYINSSNQPFWIKPITKL
jgi:hypothetical protein